MARSSSPRPDDNDCLRLPATSSPRTRGAEKKESTDLHLSQPCPPYVTPSSISSFGRRLSSAHIAESKFLKNTGANRFCQSSASAPRRLRRTQLDPACQGRYRRRHNRHRVETVNLTNKTLTRRTVLQLSAGAAALSAGM